MMEQQEVKRLNWGCGGHTLPGWINSDNKEGPDINLSCDIRDGLPLAGDRGDPAAPRAGPHPTPRLRPPAARPLAADSVDYAASIHALPEVPFTALVPVLQE